MKKKALIYASLFVSIGLLLAACGAQGPEGPAGPQGEPGPAGPPSEASDLSCTDCHNDSTVITGTQTAWSTSLHGSGESYAYAGSRAECAGCHSGGAFSERIAAGITDPNQVAAGDPNPTRQDCRTCHQIHTTYTKDDFALETTDPVALIAFAGQTYDGGMGNLCANCHQPRTAFPEAVDGQVEVTSTHWGPHHGPESAILLGIGGAGDVVGSPSKHASQVEDTCVACHMGADRSHTFTPSVTLFGREFLNVTTCQECHEGVEDFDVNGVQTQVQTLLDELQSLLVAKGLLTSEGSPVVGTYPENEAGALWNWILIAEEDGSLGVHNPTYTIDLLEASIAVFK